MKQEQTTNRYQRRLFIDRRAETNNGVNGMSPIGPQKRTVQRLASLLVGIPVLLLLLILLPLIHRLLAELARSLLVTSDVHLLHSLSEIRVAPGIARRWRRISSCLPRLAGLPVGNRQLCL